MSLTRNSKIEFLLLLPRRVRAPRYGLAHTMPHAVFPRIQDRGEFLVDRAMLGLSGAVIGLVYWPSMLHDDWIALAA